MSAPRGTVTFLFSDIEGSTRLWETFPEAMGAALARHDALLRQSIENNAGFVFKTVGDAFCAAFPTAPDALAAAVNAQRALQAEAWGETGPLRVRMGIHTGIAEERDNDYFGATLNRVARLQSLAHGGQVLLSQSAYELARDHLPSDVSLCVLGTHRLKDLLRPEQIAQALHPDLPAEFPPLQSLDKLPTNLPYQTSSFIGREREIAEIKARLQQTRLLTLAATGGVGKTRLALQVAVDLIDRYPDGVWFIELAPLADPALVVRALASVLNIADVPGRTPLETLVDALRTKTLLLILDNCEHLIAECAQVADTLLRRCPHVSLLATSREALAIPGETLYRIPPLSLPAPQTPSSVEGLSQYEAVRLFIERAVAVLPTFTVTNQNAPAVAQICACLDGIPLAIELAAARMRVMPLEQIASRLDNRFHLLTGGSRAALPRQQTLRALIDWSYELLSEQEKSLLRTLSVFAGGWTLEAAESVGADAGIEAWEVLDLLTRLVDKSLVVYEAYGPEARYHLLETLRQYGRERLTERGDLEGVQSRCRDFFLSLAETAEPHLLGAEQTEWLQRLEQERDNFRATLDHCEQEGNPEAAFRITRGIWRYWMIRGYLSEGRERMARLLAIPGGSPLWRGRAYVTAGNLAYMQGDYPAARKEYEAGSPLLQAAGDEQGRAAVLSNLGLIAWQQGEFPAATAFTRESLEIRQRLGDKRGIATSLNGLGNIARSEGDLTTARSLFTQALAGFQEVGDRHSAATALYNLGAVACQQQDYGPARLFLEESLSARQELGDKQGVAGSLLGLGAVYLDLGDLATAQTHFQESLALQQELDDRHGCGASLYNLGTIALAQGDAPAARPLLQQSLRIFSEMGEQNQIFDILEALAELILLERKAREAVTLFAAADQLRKTSGAAGKASTRAAHDRLIAEARTDMGENLFREAWSAGHDLTLEQAIAFALLHAETSSSSG